MIAKLYTAWIYISAFMTTVVPTCIQPENIKYCYRIDQWLIPEVIYGINVMFDPCFYCDEQKYLSGDDAGDQHQPN